MYCVMRNHTNTFDYILNKVSKEESKEKPSLNHNSVDSQEGRSLIHYIVEPLTFGSFENEELLRKALTQGFNPLIQDKSGLTPYEYACRQ